MRKKTGYIKPAKLPTLVQVAHLAGVGIGTASRVLNNEGYVSDATAARVQAVIKRLGYKPNEVARNLKVRRSGAVGIVVPDLGDPFVATCVQAAQSVIRSHGNISILTFSEGKHDIEAKEIDYLIRRQIDGLLIIPAGGGSGHLTPASLHGTPLVSFDMPIPGRRGDAVLVENKKGTIEGVRHLVEHGHKRIACLGINKHLYTITKRIEGYHEVMAQSGLTPNIAIVEPTLAAVSAQLEQFLNAKRPPTAIFSLNGLVSIYLLRALADFNVRVPEQLAVVGFDELQLADLLALVSLRVVSAHTIVRH